MQAASATVAVGVILLLAIGLSVLFGLIFAYHWLRFGRSAAITTIALFVYASGCLAIISLLFFAAQTAL